MPCKKVVIRPFFFEEKDWTEANGRQHHVNPPADTAFGPFWQTLGPEDDDKDVFSMVREGISYFNSNNNMIPKSIEVYHIAIREVGVRMDAKCRELEDKDELLVYFEI